MDAKAHSIDASAPCAPSLAGQSVHLIGIGGAGMRALAKMLLDSDAVVSGSDMADGATVARLGQAGATIHIGQRAENLPERCDLVVYSAAITESSPELIAARQRGCQVLKYSQMLGALMARRKGLAIAGTHGKSTTTAMVAYALRAAGADPSFIIGAIADQLGGPSGVGKGECFVAEACEFDRSFLNLQPYAAAILNIEEDHLDCYRDLDAIVEAFRCFAARVRPSGVLIVNGEDRNAVSAAEAAGCEVETFGQTGECTWRGQVLDEDRGCLRLAITYRAEPFIARLAVPLPGLHNAYNSLAATALLHHADVSAEAIAEHLATFKGTQRRMTEKGTAAGVTVMDDYAHHPTEIQVTLRAIRQHYSPRRLICIFQPHQHSRTRFLLKDFARSFAAADEVIVPDIYFVRDTEREKEYICSEDLVRQIRLHGGSAVYCESFEAISARLRAGLSAGDLVVTMGAGNIWELADETLRWLRDNC
jgi:UDP-N-acetylmuramate--alanine ligase